MLEKPNLREDKIISCLNNSYGISVSRIEFLPVGNAPNSWAHKVKTDRGKTYFLKVKRGEIYEPSVFVPRYLKDEGIEEVVTPLPNKAQRLWDRLDNFILILYPYIEGNTAEKIGMSDEQWIEIGSVLERIHTSKLSSPFLNQVQKEAFTPKWSASVKNLQERIDQDEYLDAFGRGLTLFWKERAEEMKQIVNRAEQLGGMLQHKTLEFVLCHSDIHTDNILISDRNEMFIVDWDNPILAPKERDLMFIVGRKEEELFFRGYGRVDVDPIALAYYGYEWVVQEIGDYGERVFLMSDVGEETKKDAVGSFFELFQPNNVVEAAYKSDPEEQR